MTTIPAKIPESIQGHQFLSATDIMNLLKVSRGTLYNLMFRKDNPLPSVRIGKSRRFPFDKVKVWMENLGH